MDEIENRLISLEKCVNLYLYLNAETRKIFESNNSKNRQDIEALINLYDILASYIKLEEKSFSNQKDYVKNLNTFIVGYQEEIARIKGSTSDIAVKNEYISLYIIGYDDGIKESLANDREEALYDAKLKALEKVNVNQAITLAKKKINNSIFDTEKAESVLFDIEVADIGYIGDTYQVSLKCKVRINNENK